MVNIQSYWNVDNEISLEFYFSVIKNEMKTPWLTYCANLVFVIFQDFFEMFIVTRFLKRCSLLDCSIPFQINFRHDF